MNNDPRAALLDIYQAAVTRVKGFDAVKSRLSVGPLQGTHHLIAIGKAASSMAEGALAVMGDDIAAGLVITKRGHTGERLRDYPQVRALESEHPVPGAGSLEAGSALLEFIEQAPANARFLILISGGASSLVEVLPEGFDAEALRELNTWLLGSGLDIGRMNRIRQAVSLIKAGRLARFLNGRETTALLISDVPGDDPAAIGSGLLAPRRDQAPLPELPEQLDLGRAELNPLPKPGDPIFKSITVEVIATLEDAKHAAAKRAKALGYAVTVSDEFLADDMEKTGCRLAAELLEAVSGVYIWGGETSGLLPENPGRGGRNQHVALAAALELQGKDSVWFLAAGTDGTDGPTEDAGALVDGGTIQRGEDGGLNAEQSLAAFDEGHFLEASGDLVTTGPTGTNVMDMAIGLKT